MVVRAYVHGERTVVQVMAMTCVGSWARACVRIEVRDTADMRASHVSGSGKRERGAGVLGYGRAPGLAGPA